MAEGNKWGRCKAFDGFKELLEELRSCYSRLNPKDGLCSRMGALDYPRGRDVAKEFIRGGIIRVMAAWEAYVQDVLKEAFDTVVEICGNDVLKEVFGAVEMCANDTEGSNSTDESLTRWPECHAVLHKAIERRVRKHPGCTEENLQQLFHHKATPMRIASLQQFLSKKSDSEKESILQVEVALDLAMNKDHLKELVDEHRDHMLRQLLTPLFDGDGGIDNAFRRLFGIVTNSKQDKFALSSKVVAMGNITHTFTFTGGRQLELEITRGDVMALNHVMRLYYGARCAFAHGDHRRTMAEVLQNFPKKACDLHVGDLKIAETLFELYQGIDKEGRRAKVEHLTLVNLCRFVSCAVHRLCLAIAHWVYDRFHICIWTYDPSRDESLKEQEEPLLTGLYDHEP